MKRFTVVLVAGWMLSGGVVPALAIAQDQLPVVTAKQGKNKPKPSDDPIVPIYLKPH